jgi:CUG-BP- and ETR3-like factor
MRRDDAERAIKALDGRYRDKEAPGNLQIRFAHTKQEKAILQSSPASNMGMGSMQGMGMAGPAAAANFGSLYGFPGMGVNPFAQQGAGLASLAGQQQQQMGQFNPQQYMNQFSGMQGMQQPAAASSAGRNSDTVKGPAGCNLFIYNLPLAFSDTDLAALFANFGNVLSSHIQRDKSTGASKGFGFVSFDNQQSANAAIASLDNFVLSGRKISVRLKKENTGGVGKPY